MSFEDCERCGHPRYGSFKGVGHFTNKGPCKDTNCYCMSFMTPEDVKQYGNKN